MNNPEKHNPQVMAEYANRRKKQLMVSIPLVLVIFGFVFGENAEAGTILGFPAQYAGPVFFVIVVGALIFSFFNWKCPGCNKYLGKAFNPKYCHHCGTVLHD
jgi:hypothetical protein